MLESVFSIDTLWWILVCLYVPACIGLIVIVLLQKGKGTNFAGAFGVGGGSDAVFGPRSSQSLVVRLTYLAAAAFMIIAVIMSIISGKVGKGIAPETVQIDETNAISSTELSDLGLGSGEVDQSRADEAEATASAIETEPPAQDAQGVATETTEEEPAKEEEAPQEETNEEGLTEEGTDEQPSGPRS